MTAGGGVKYLEDGKVYLIGFNQQAGQYIAAVAIDEGIEFAMQYQRGEGDSVLLYNRRGVVVGSNSFADGQEQAAFFNAISDEFFAYNSQQVYFEASDDIDLTTFVVIP